MAVLLGCGGLRAELTPDAAEAQVQADDVPVAFLRDLCDDHGGRLSGSAANAAALDDLEQTLREMGFNPTRDWFEMPGWERGPDRVHMVEPAQREMRAIALGYVGPSEQHTGPVIDFGSGAAEDFDREIPPGAIGLFGPSSSGRPNEVTARALAHGLAGLLMINRVGGGQVLARTGGFHGEPLPLPVFSITQEEGFWMRRRLERDEPVEVSIEVRSRRLPPQRLANLHLRFPGKSADTIVVGAHFDSWDLGQGAMDNGLGIAQLLALARVLQGQSLERSVELIWFNGEEQGLWGSRHAVAQIRDEPNAAPILMLNLDMVGVPIGVNALGDDDLVPALQRWHEGRGVDRALEKGVENKPWIASDHTPYQLAGVRAVTFNAPIPADSVRYYHDFGDTYDKLTPELIRESAAMVASLVVALANDPDLPLGLRAPEVTQQLFLEAKLDGRLRAVGLWPFSEPNP